MAEPLYQILGRHRSDPLPDRKPSWLKVRAPGGPGYARLKGLMRELDLHTVCEEARCPNVGECWDHGTATFMILGDVCTRNCAYCAVSHGRPPRYDMTEPERVGRAIGEMRLQHAVITSVDRDDLPDFGAWAFAETIRQIHARVPDCSVEVLVPDFQGNEESIRTVLEARPEIYNHNTETVPRLFRRARAADIHGCSRSSASRNGSRRTSRRRPASFSASARPPRKCCRRCGSFATSTSTSSRSGSTCGRRTSTCRSIGTSRRRSFARC